MIRHLVFGFLFLGVVAARSADPADWLDALIRYIAEESDANRVTVITDLEPGERVASRRIEETIGRVTSKFPVARMNLRLDASLDSSLLADTDIDATDAVDTFNAFFLILHESQERDAHSDDSRLRRLIDAARNASTYHSIPKFLLVVESPAPLDANFESLLQHAWSRRLLDFTIVELPAAKSTVDATIGFSENDWRDPPTVHQLNPFAARYTKARWTPSVVWFPDKTVNIWGQTLTGAVLHVPLYTIVVKNARDEIVDVKGCNIDVMNATARWMNGTMNYTERTWPYMNSHYGISPLDAHKLVEAENIDVFANIFTHHTESIRYSTLRTTTIQVERLCAVMPVFWQKSQVPMSMNAAIYVMTLGVVVMYKAARFALRLDRQLWQTFSIVRVLLAGSVDRLPARMSERALYTSLLLVSASYSENIYASVTSLAVQPNVEVPVRSFEDMDRAKLTALVQNYAFNKSFSHSEGALSRIKERVQFVHTNMHHWLDVAAKNKSVMCFMRESAAMDVVQRYERSGRHEIKIVEPCLWSDGGAFLLPSGSPYRARFDEIIMRLHNAGITKKMYDDRSMLYGSMVDKGELSREADNAESESSESMKAIKKQLQTIAMVGYTASFLVFVAEHAVRWIKTRGRVATISILKKCT